jgi:hypothetical protein
MAAYGEDFMATVILGSPRNEPTVVDRGWPSATARPGLSETPGTRGVFRRNGALMHRGTKLAPAAPPSIADRRDPGRRWRGPARALSPLERRGRVHRIGDRAFVHRRRLRTSATPRKAW